MPLGIKIEGINMDKEKLTDVLNDIKNGKLSVADALKYFRDFPFKDMDFIKLDYQRDFRKKLGEVIYAKGKSVEQLEVICRELKSSGKETVVFTKTDIEKAKVLLSIDDKLKYNVKAGIVYKTKAYIKKAGLVIVLTAGTSDINIAEEAVCIAEIMGSEVKSFHDVGVAGIHRLFAVYDELQKADVIIAAAGMEGALPTVVAGLVDVPVIALPTSVGYGASLKGISALLTMLNSCSPGIAVVNIDNGFGAGYLAHQIANKGEK